MYTMESRKHWHFQHLHMFWNGMIFIKVNIEQGLIWSHMKLRIVLNLKFLSVLQTIFRDDGQKVVH